MALNVLDVAVGPTIGIFVFFGVLILLGVSLIIFFAVKAIKKIKTKVEK